VIAKILRHQFFYFLFLATRETPFQTFPGVLNLIRDVAGEDSNESSTLVAHEGDMVLIGGS
jgi:hypothetical protein